MKTRATVRQLGDLTARSLKATRGGYARRLRLAHAARVIERALPKIHIDAGGNPVAVD